MESMSIYAGTTKPILAPSKFGPKSTNLSSYSANKSPCVPGNQAATIPSASPDATASHITALSSGVTVTSNPKSSNTNPTTFVEATSVSHSTYTSSILSPSTSSIPSVQASTLSSFSPIHSSAASFGSAPSETFNITSSKSSEVQLKLSNNAYASGMSSSKPSRTIVLIVSASPKVPSGSSKYFKSYLANFQCGDQPVTTIGSSFLIASPNAVAIAPLEEACTSQPSKS